MNNQQEPKEYKESEYRASKLLANAIGLNEAIFINHVRGFCEHNAKHNKDAKAEGYFWTFSTYEELASSYLAFMSVETIKDIVSKLRRMGILIVGNFFRARFKRDNWYRIDEGGVQAYLEYYGAVCDLTGEIKANDSRHKIILDAYIAFQAEQEPKYTEEYFESRRNEQNSNMTDKFIFTLQSCQKVLLDKVNLTLSIEPDRPDEELNKELIKEKTLTPKPTVVGVTKPILKKQSLYDHDLTPLQVNETETLKGENWLVGIAKQMWGRELSEAQIKELGNPVRAVIGTHIGNYPSPLEYAHDDRYHHLFREWVLSKKDPRKDMNISVGGMKKWIKHHIRNYDSPEGFLVWLNRVHGIDLVPQKSVTVMAERKYNLVEMDMFVHNRSRPLDEYLISKAFREFYEANISQVSSNEQFKQLWENKQ